MSRTHRRSLLLIPLAASAAGLLGCGSNPAGPPAVPCTQATVFTGTIEVPPNTQVVQPFSTQSTGRIGVTVDWLSGINLMSVVLSQAPCSISQLQASACNVQFSLFSPPKPLTSSTSLLRAGGYDLIIANLNAVPERATSVVTLTSAGCPTGAVSSTGTK
ncbi:MAG TPA: hypothetical protein VK576_02175 [Thermoleophilia bacterium]|nr:hypothetical protein [Thermoleophilia bacterium]